jgi:hypothetical protein
MAVGILSLLIGPALYTTAPENIHGWTNNQGPAGLIFTMALVPIGVGMGIILLPIGYSKALFPKYRNSDVLDTGTKEEINRAVGLESTYSRKRRWDYSVTPYFGPGGGGASFTLRY